jgi:hypothetical protein
MRRGFYGHWAGGDKFAIARGAIGPSRTGITRDARVLPREMRSEKSSFARDAQSPSRTAVIRPAACAPQRKVRLRETRVLPGAFCLRRAKFDEAAFYFAVHGLTKKPAFLDRTIVVRAHARAALVGSDDRVPGPTFGKPVKMAAEDRPEVQPIAALQ